MVRKVENLGKFGQLPHSIELLILKESRAHRESLIEFKKRRVLWLRLATTLSFGSGLVL
jgi:hypothetical protein